MFVDAFGLVDRDGHAVHTDNLAVAYVPWAHVVHAVSPAAPETYPAGESLHVMDRRCSNISTKAQIQFQDWTV